MTQLRKRMLEELQRRNYSPTTIRCYLRVVEAFARHFGKRPDHLTGEHIREYHLYLLRERKLTPRTVGLHISALRFFFVKTLRRPYVQVDLPYPKMPERYPLFSCSTPRHRTLPAPCTMSYPDRSRVLFSGLHG